MGYQHNANGAQARQRTPFALDAGLGLPGTDLIPSVFSQCCGRCAPHGQPGGESDGEGGAVSALREMKRAAEAALPTFGDLPVLLAPSNHVYCQEQSVLLPTVTRRIIPEPVSYLSVSTRVVCICITKWAREFDIVVVEGAALPSRPTVTGCAR